MLVASLPCGYDCLAYAKVDPWFTERCVLRHQVVRKIVLEVTTTLTLTYISIQQDGSGCGTLVAILALLACLHSDVLNAEDSSNNIIVMLHI